LDIKGLLIAALLAGGILLAARKAPPTNGNGPPPPPPPPPPSSPSAIEGYGAQTIGGRGGSILSVTNINDSGPGSLRAALTATGPRTVIFRTGGIIRLASPIAITEPFLTIAGQTAPGGGILVSVDNPVNNNMLRIATHNVIIQYVRFRNDPSGEPGGGQVNVGIQEGAYNIVIDHCSLSWSLDDMFQIWRNSISPLPDTMDITVQWSIFAEALAGHSTAMIIGATEPASAGEHLKTRNITVHHNLYVHNMERNPYVKTGVTEIKNNVVYNWENPIMETRAQTTIDIVNNYWKPGPMSSEPYIVHDAALGTTPNASIYVNGNVLEGINTAEQDDWALLWDYDSRGPLSTMHQRLTPLPSPPPIPVTLETAANAYNSVLSDVGANRRLNELGEWVVNQDSVDLRVIADVLAGTGWAPTAPATIAQAGGMPVIASGTPYVDSDNDGMPDAWEIAHGLNPNVPNGNGHDLDPILTNLEVFLRGPVLLSHRQDRPGRRPHRGLSARR